MYCPRCGCKVSDAGRFCPQCGCAMPTATSAGPRPAPAPAPAPQPAPTPQPAPSSAPQPTSPPAPEPATKPTRRRWPLVLGIVLAVLLALGLAGVLLLGNGTGTEDAEDATDDASAEGTQTQAVAYYDSSGDVTMSSSTLVVLWDDDGEALEDFDLMLMDDEGAVSTYHVDGDGFTPQGLGVAEGHYAMVALDPQTNDAYTVPSLVVEAAGDDASDVSDGSEASGAETGSDEDTSDADDESDADDASGAETDATETLVIKPAALDGQEADAVVADASLQVAYALYYARVLELQGTYGVGTLDDAGECISGVSIVGLYDLIGDGDGIDELVIVYEDGDGELTVEVWAYDAEANDIELVCEEPLGDTDDAQMLTVYGHEGATTALLWTHWPYEDDTVAFESHYVFLEDGELVHHSTAYVVDYATDEVSYAVDGETVDEEAYEDAVDSNAHVYEDVSWRCNWCVSVYDAEEWATYVSDDGISATYDPTDTLAMTEDTIELLAQGMMGRLDDEDDETDETEADVEDATSDATSDLERYAEVLDAIYDGITSGWDGYDYDTAPISYLWWTSYSSTDAIDSLGEAGYAFVDLDGDGTNELVVAVFQGTGWFSYPYDVYSYVDGKVVHLQEQGERYGFTLLSNGLIYVWGSGGASTTYRVLYELVGGELQLVEAVTYDSSENEDNPWFYSTTTTDVSQMESISADEAEAIMDTWFAEHEELEFTYTYFSDYER